MTKRVLTSGVIIVIMAVLAVFSLFALPGESAYADEPVLPTTQWAASASLGGSGSEASPYIISKPEDLAYLANAVSTGNTFQGAHFSLITDLDLSGFLTRPIGSYTGSVNRPFMGIFEGNGHTLHSLIISSTSDYTALFSFLGSGGVVRNLTIDSDSIINGGRYAGSLAGRCSGTVSGIASYADVRGTSHIGGIVGNSYQGNVYDSFFVGSLTFTLSGFGIEGANTNGVTQGCWYITDNFNYAHNSRGNILYVGSNGSVTPALTEGKVSFTLTPNAGFEAEVRTADESVITTEDEYTPEAELNNASYFARFVKTVTIAPVTNGTASGAGTYYEGQSVKISVKPNDGCYFDSISSAISPEDAHYSNGIDNSVIYSFTMLPTDMEFSVTVATFSPDPSAIVSEFTYDGEPKAATDEASLKLSGAAYADFTFNIAYFSPTLGTLPAPPSRAGEYAAIVTIYNTLGGAPIIIGRVEYPYTINRAQLSISDTSVFPITKEYDNLAVYQMSVEGSNYEVVDGDTVIMKANVVYYTDHLMDTVALARGENYYICYSFLIEGADSGNYLPPEDVVLSGASITRKLALVSIEERYLSKVFDDSPPSIGAYDVDSVGGIDISFIFTNISAPGSVSDVGLYSVAVQFNPDKPNPNNDNHILQLADEFIYEIRPKQVAVHFSNYSNLSYTGAVQSITAVHDTIYAGIPLPANIRYEMDGVEVPLLNAGTYTAYASSDSPNYVITGTDYCTFTVAKINQTTPLVIEQIEDIVYTALPLILTAEGGNGEGEISYTLVSGRASIEDDILTILGGGRIEVTATKAESQNYFAATSAIMSFEVQKAQLIVSVTNTENYITYNDILQLPLTYTGFVEGEEHLSVPAGLVRPTIYLDGQAYLYNTNVRLNVREQGYPITLSGADSDGYEITADNSGGKMLYVTKKSLTVRANSMQKIYGQNDPVLTYTIDEGAFALSGSLSREEGNDVREYDIYQNTLNNDNNPNFSLTFYPAVFTINQASLTIRPYSKSKVYGEQDPAIEYQIIGLVYSDTCEVTIEREPGESPGFYLYLLTDFTVSDNYFLIFNDQNRGLTINTILPVIFELPQRSTIIYGNALTESEFSGGIVKAVTNEGEMTITGTFSWEEDVVFPDTADGNTTLYTVRFIPDDEENYRQFTFECTVNVAPKQFSVVYTGAQQLVYNGQAQKLVSATPDGVLNGDEINFSFSYSGDMIDVGTYYVIPFFDNPNYTLAPDSEYQVRIVKKSLDIALQPAVYDDDKVPSPVFIYTGFAGDEDESVLSALPRADMPSEAGSYSVTPYGAQAGNYQISYTAGAVVVKQSVLYTQNENITAVGSYDAEVSFDADVHDSGASEEFGRFVEDFKQFKLGKPELNGLAVKKGYSFSFMRDGEETEPGELITIRIRIPDNLSRARSYALLRYTQDGEIEIVQDARIEGKYLIIKTDQMGDYVLVTNNDYTIFVVLSVIAGVAALFILMDAGIRRRRRMGGPEYHKRYVNAYRQAKRERKAEHKFEKMRYREAKRRGRQFKYVKRDDIY
ncbi:MAG: MBG domain-containing protein [Christensenellales bacterium]|jgi:hypothetical protein